MSSQAFAGAGPLLFMNSPQPIDGGQIALAAAYRTAQAEPVLAPTMLAEKTWPYERFGAPGKAGGPARAA